MLHTKRFSTFDNSMWEHVLCSVQSLSALHWNESTIGLSCVAVLMNSLKNTTTLMDISTLTHAFAAYFRDDEYALYTFKAGASFRELPRTASAKFARRVAFKRVHDVFVGTHSPTLLLFKMYATAR